MTRLLLAALATVVLVAGVVLAVAFGSDRGDDAQPSRLTAATAQAVADGTSASAAGFTLELDRRRGDTIAFRLRREGGRRYELVRWQERPLHAFLVRRDLTVFRRLDVAGSAEAGFTAPMPELQPGPYRLIVDFTVGKREIALGADVEVPGAYEARPLPTVDAPLELGDGRRIAVSHRTLYEREKTPFSFALTDEGGVLPLERHLTTWGFLGLVRADSLAYTHGHPVSRDQALFSAVIPRAGDWVAFYEYRLDGEVRVAPVRVTVNPASA